jgi:hypothetical protein
VRNDGASHGPDRLATYFERFDFLLLLLLPALLKAIATACFCGLPALISVLMLELTVLRDDPFLSGMAPPASDHVEQIKADDDDERHAEQPKNDSAHCSISFLRSELNCP